MRSHASPIFLTTNLLLMVGLMGLSSCGDDESSGDALDFAGDGVDRGDMAEEVSADPFDGDSAGDVEGDALSDFDDGDRAIDPPDDLDEDGSELGDVEEPPIRFEIGLPFPEAPADLLEDTGEVSCSIYLEEQCQDGQLLRCELYDTDTQQWVDSPDPLLHRVLLYERWYDLYHAPDGQTCDRMFHSSMAAGTPEETWGSPSNFDRYRGEGDAAIWTGVALNGYLMRYLNTGTDADYERMETKVRQLLTLFDVTGIPGYLARHHFLFMEPGAPDTDRHILHFDEAGLDHRDHEIEHPEAIEGLPQIYLNGLEDDEGTIYRGTPMWHGNPSIDQYTGPMVTFPAVWGLLRDERLQERIATHITCYLKRLQRIEVINLQSNEDLRELFQEWFAGGQLDLEPDDFDFGSLDTIVGYVHRSINSTNEEVFDRSCPDTVQLEPYRVIDASAPTTQIIAEVLELMYDLQSRDYERPGSIDHFYVPSVRGGDAMHLMHLASMSFAMTGDERYLDFLRDELLGSLHTVEIAHTLGALVEPPWCRSFYGNHITFSPLWAFINLLGDSPLRTEMQRVMHIEAWQKVNFNLENAKFNLMYAGVVPPDIGTAREQALATALQALQTLGGNGGVFDDPRRHYDQPRESIIASLPEDIELVCPTEEERTTCEEGPTIFGIEIPLEPITHPCQDISGECVMDDGVCTWAMASSALPMELRRFESFLWQRNPFAIGNPTSESGTHQAPGLDLIESYWLARHYGFITEGRGKVMAWRPVASCE